MSAGAVKRVAACVVAALLLGCAGPNGERAALDNAVVRPGSGTYNFSGGYVGATGGAGLQR